MLNYCLIYCYCLIFHILKNDNLFKQKFKVIFLMQMIKDCMKKVIAVNLHQSVQVREFSSVCGALIGK